MDADTRKNISKSRDTTARPEIKYANQHDVMKTVKQTLPSLQDALDYLYNARGFPGGVSARYCYRTSSTPRLRPE